MNPSRLLLSKQTFGVIYTDIFLLGVPSPKFSWFKDNVEVRHDENHDITTDGGLTIKSFKQKEHAGKYFCLLRVDNEDIELKLKSREAVIRGSSKLYTLS